MFFKLWQVLFFLYLWVFLVLFSKFIFTLAQNTYKIGIIKRVEKSITMRKKGFSIAEALMVLLIMSIIVAVSMPVLTKKSRRKTAKIDSGLWKDYRHEFVAPVDNRDVALGNDAHEKGIRIIGKLSLKDLGGTERGWVKDDGSVFVSALHINEKLFIRDMKGKDIGWIKDDGSSSFETIPPGMMMTFIGQEKCPDGWMLSDGGTVETQYGPQMTPDFTSILAQMSKAQGQAPTIAICVKCSPEQNCKYPSMKERRY